MILFFQFLHLVKLSRFFIFNRHDYVITTTMGHLPSSACSILVACRPAPTCLHVFLFHSFCQFRTFCRFFRFDNMFHNCCLGANRPTGVSSFSESKFDANGVISLDAGSDSGRFCGVGMYRYFVFNGFYSY